MSIPPVPFANNKCYGSKQGIRNKIRSASE